MTKKLYKFRLLLITPILCVILLTSCNSHKEKDKILIYYSKITEFTKSIEYRQIYNNFESLSRRYRSIANECGYDSDDHITRIVSAHYDNDTDIVRVRNNWISIKNEVDSVIKVSLTK
jgi:hypothetical protein